MTNRLSFDIFILLPGILVQTNAIGCSTGGISLWRDRYCRDASQRPLQAIPPEAPFHLPDPPFPLSWPFACAPRIETLTIPSLPMLPETSAAPETFPSVTVSGYRTDGSQFPALVRIVTFQRPS
jgi:hypothetical protein